MTISRPALPSIAFCLVATALLLLPTAAWAVDVQILEEATDPDPVVAQVGEAIVFTNARDGDVRLIDDDERWDSGVLAPGESFRITFDVEGTITFTSEDGSVTGTIEVLDGPPTPDAEPTVAPTAEPTEEPAGEPTEEPAGEPTDEPAGEPTADATAAPAPTEGPAADALAATGTPVTALVVLMVGAAGLGALLLRRSRRVR